MVAIEIALGFIETESSKKKIDNVKIFCDSQSAVGLLTLGWTPSSYKGTISKIKKQLESLRQTGMEIDISWTQGHADIAGNEIADRLAKEAAKEAEEVDENQDKVVTAAKVSCEKKWQRRWDLTNSGRDLYVYRKYVGVKSKKYVHQQAWGQLF